MITLEIEHDRNDFFIGFIVEGVKVGYMQTHDPKTKLSDILTEAYAYAMAWRRDQIDSMEASLVTE